MASYNKSKLLRLMEQRHAAHLNLADLSRRFRDAKEEMGTVKSKILAYSSRLRLPDGLLERLLSLPTNEALSLTADEIETYTSQQGEDAPRYKTGVNFTIYRQYIQARDKAARLNEARESAENDFHERYGIVPRLIEAVREWGFADPELEM